MKLSGMNIVIKETQMSKEMHDEFVCEMAELVAAEYIKEAKEKEKP